MNMESKHKVGDEVTTVEGLGLTYKVAEIFKISDMVNKTLSYGYKVSHAGRVYPNIYLESGLLPMIPKWKPKFKVGDYVTQKIAVKEDKVKENVCRVIRIPSSKECKYLIQYGVHEFPYNEKDLVKIKKVETWEVIE